MAEKQDRQVVSRRSGGFFVDLSTRAKLIGRLMLDGRINPLLKLLPLASLVYLLFPDIPGPIDDALVMWLGTYLFVELCPNDVVQEHTRAIQNVIPGNWGDVPPAAQSRREEIVEGEFYETDPNQSKEARSGERKP